MSFCFHNTSVTLQVDLIVLYLRNKGRHRNILVIKKTFKYYLNPRRVTYTNSKCYWEKIQMWILFWIRAFVTKHLIAIDSEDNVKRANTVAKESVVIMHSYHSLLSSGCLIFYLSGESKN